MRSDALSRERAWEEKYKNIQSSLSSLQQNLDTTTKMLAQKTVEHEELVDLHQELLQKIKEKDLVYHLVVEDLKSAKMSSDSLERESRHAQGKTLGPSRVEKPPTRAMVSILNLFVLNPHLSHNLNQIRR